MATVSGYTAQRMKEIEDSAVIGGFVDLNGRLLLERHNGETIDAGSVLGPQGPIGVGPTGAVTVFAGDAAPAGYLLCRGSAVSRTAYAALFAVIGTKYGAGDGVTTFNLPNLQGRVIVGQQPADTDFDVVGEMGGSKTHVLTTAEMPPHTHVQNAHTHVQNAHDHTQTAHNHRMHPTSSTFHAVQWGGGNGVNVYLAGVQMSAGVAPQNELSIAQGSSNQTNSVAPAIQGSVAVNQAATATNQNAGGGAGHNNMQPYIVMNYIIRT